VTCPKCGDLGQNRAAAPGTPASVSVDVTCVVVVNGLHVPGLPTTRTVHDRAVSPVDPYRSATSPTTR
jgi:hypothetical protein